MLRLSANLGFLWPELPLLDRIRAARDHEFDAVELHWPYDVPASAIAAACEKYNLAVLALNTPRGDNSVGEFGLAALPGREAEFKEGLGIALSYAQSCNAPMIHVMAGVADDCAENEKVLIENVRLAAEIAAERDITVLLEPLNPVDRPGYFYSTIERAETIRECVARSNVKLMFDVYHSAMVGGDVIAQLDRFLPVIGHIQIAAVPTRAEPDEGDLDYRVVFQKIMKLNYQGWIGCEYRPRGDTNAGLRWRQHLL